MPEYHGAMRLGNRLALSPAENCGVAVLSQTGTKVLAVRGLRWA